jgi:hypothetical protein
MIKEGILSAPPPIFGAPQPDPNQPQPWPDPSQPQAWTGPAPVRPSQYPPPQGSWPGPYLDPADPLISPDYGSWWRRTTTIVKNHWRTLATLQALNAGASFVVLGLAYAVQSAWTLGLSQTPVNTPDVSPSRVFGGLGLVFAGVIITVLITFLVQLATTHVVVSAASGAPVNVAGSLRAALRRLLPLVGWTLLGGLIILGGVCACFLPAIYFGAVLYTLPVVVMVERTGVISRCFTLFNKNLGVSVSRIATLYGLGLAGAAITTPIQLLVHTATGTSASTGAVVIGSLISTAFQVVVTAAVSIVTGPALVTAYADMRARVEPVSIAVIASQVFAG